MAGSVKQSKVIHSSTARESSAAKPERRQLIAMRAYFKAEARGFSPGHEVDDWLEAERELIQVASAPKH